MFKTSLIYHPDYLKHDTGPGHPERPARLEAILERLQENSFFPHLLLLEPRPAPVEAVARSSWNSSLKQLMRTKRGNQP